MMASAERWDVLVVGAGPAGAVAATLLARRGLRTLLVERRAFPRAKACGGCLGPRALDLLRDADLLHVVERLGAPRLHALRLRLPGASVEVALAEGRAVDRASFDAALVEEAVRAGATFRDGTRAVVAPSASAEHERAARLEADGRDPCLVSARVVLAADGLAHPSLGELPELHATVPSSARVGLAASWSPEQDTDPPGTIAMSVGRHGYVGAVRTAGGRLAVAAALDPAWMRERGPADAVAAIWREVDAPFGAPSASAGWIGTPALTRKEVRRAGHRLFLLGDAAGYVEPFTGEGMTWALASAIAVVPHAVRACERWEAGAAHAWEREQARAVGGGQRACRTVAALLRRPALVSALARLAMLFPGGADAVAARLRGPRRPGMASC